MDPLTIAVVLFLAGVVLGVAEIFIPSAGVLVVLSVAAFVGSVYCAFEISPAWGISFVLAVPLVMLVAVVKGFKVFPKTLFGRRMILARPDERQEAESVDAAAHDTSAGVDRDLVGKEGTARTDLRPSGSAQIGPQRYDVVSEGEYIDQGTKVRVVEVRGNRIVVEAVT